MLIACRRLIDLTSGEAVVDVNKSTAPRVDVRPNGAWLHLARLPFGDGFATLATTREGRFDVVPEQALANIALMHRGKRVAAMEIPALRTKRLVSSWLFAK